MIDGASSCASSCGVIGGASCASSCGDGGGYAYVGDASSCASCVCACERTCASCAYASCACCDDDDDGQTSICGDEHDSVWYGWWSYSGCHYGCGYDQPVTSFSAC